MLSVLLWQIATSDSVYTTRATKHLEKSIVSLIVNPQLSKFRRTGDVPDADLNFGLVTIKLR